MWIPRIEHRLSGVGGRHLHPLSHLKGFFSFNKNIKKLTCVMKIWKLTGVYLKTKPYHHFLSCIYKSFNLAGMLTETVEELLVNGVASLFHLCLF